MGLRGGPPATCGRRWRGGVRRPRPGGGTSAPAVRRGSRPGGRRRSGRSRGARAAARRRGPSGSAWARKISTGSVGTPSRRSVPGVLPGLAGLRRDVEDVVGQLEGRADLLTEGSQRLLDLGRTRRRTGPRTARTSRSASRSCPRPPTGSARAGPGPRVTPRVSRIWPSTSRPKVRAWIRTASGPRSATRSEARANSQSPVRIATELSQRALALSAPRRRAASSITSSWYSVARWVSSTTTAASTTSAAAGVGAELRRQQHQQRTEPLAAGNHDVLGRLGDERGVGPGGVAERLLDRLQPSTNPGFERRVGELESQALGRQR